LGLMVVMWWLDSVGSVQALALSMPFFALARITEMAAIGTGRFVFWASLIGIRVVGVSLGALIGGLLAGGSPNPTIAAVSVSCGIGVASFVAFSRAPRITDSSRLRLTKETLLPTLVILAMSLPVWVLLNLWSPPEVIQVLIGASTMAAIAGTVGHIANPGLLGSIAVLVLGRRGRSTGPDRENLD